MESISLALQPYKDQIGNVASIVTIAQFFSGVFICKDIQKKGSTKDVPSIPFVGGIVVSLAMLKYGLLLEDPAMLRVNVAAIILNSLYCLFYYAYSQDKWNEILKPMALGVPMVGALWGYCSWENPDLLHYRYGLIVTILMLLLIGSPLMEVKEMIQKKDASKIPFVMTFMGAIVTFLWLLYAIIIMNNFMIVQNVIGFILSFVQLVLIFTLPGKTPSDSKKKTN